MGKGIRDLLTWILSIAALFAIKMLHLPSLVTVLAVITVLIFAFFRLLSMWVGKTPDKAGKTAHGGEMNGSGSW